MPSNLPLNVSCKASWLHTNSPSLPCKAKWLEKIILWARLEGPLGNSALNRLRHWVSIIYRQASSAWHTISFCLSHEPGPEKARQAWTQKLLRFSHLECPLGFLHPPLWGLTNKLHIQQCWAHQSLYCVGGKVLGYPLLLFFMYPPVSGSHTKPTPVQKVAWACTFPVVAYTGKSHTMATIYQWFCPTHIHKTSKPPWVHQPISMFNSFVEHVLQVRKHIVFHSFI